MKFDRNTVIGFVLLAVLFFAFFFYNNKEQAASVKEKQRQDSIANAGKPKPDPIAQKRDSLAADSQRHMVNAGQKFQQSARGSEQFTTVSTDLFNIVFTTKGGQPKYIELKKFRDKDSGQVKLAANAFNQISYSINTGSGSVAQTGELYFEPATVEKKADGNQVVSFRLVGGDSSTRTNYITHQFTVRPKDYMIDMSVVLANPNDLLTNGDLNLNWQYAAAQQESALSFEKENTQVGFLENGDFDYFTIGKRDAINFDDGPVKWIGVRQRFFNTFLVARDNFTSGTMKWTIPQDNEKLVVKTTAAMKVKVPAGMNTAVPFSIYYGPSDFHELQSHKLDFEKLVNLGQGVYSFVRPINRWIVLPVWDFISNFVTSYGLVIALLTLFIRLLISPLTYKSYLSGAKMKALRPEIALLKEKHGGDQQAMSMEQMKLFREAGVNPLGGCIPALLQIPIFFALYSFFNANVDLRGADFLWSKDLSAYDAPIHFGTHIPLIGDHLSLFTITAVVTSMLISLYSMSMSPDQSNPLMKWMPYIFPVFLLFIFNNLPSALTWYYTVSNLITLALQFVIQNYIIDHNKILAQIQENRKKPKTKSKFQERMEQMQEQQKKLKDMQQRGKK